MSRMVIAEAQGSEVVAAERAHVPPNTDIQVTSDEERLTPEVSAALSLRIAEAEAGVFVSAEEMLDGLRGRRRSALR